MKSIKNLLLLTIFTFFAIQPAHSQGLLKNIQKRAEKKIEERMEKKADEQIDKELDKAENKLDEALESNEEESETNANSKSSRENRVQNLMKGFGMSGEPVPVADEYRFSHVIQMHFESFNKSLIRKLVG